MAITLAIAAALGFLSGLGTGGGSLLLLYLTVISGVDPNTARIINLLFFLPSAVISCIFHWRQGVLSLRNAFPIILAGCITAAVTSYLSKFLNLDILKKLFGILLLYTGAKELFYRPKKER